MSSTRHSNTRLSGLVLLALASTVATSGCGNKGALRAAEAEVASLRQQVGTMEGQLGQLESDYAAATSRAQRLESELQEVADREKATLDRLERMTILRLPETALFNSGSASMSGAGAKLLKDIGGILAEYPSYEIRVEGHTDNVPLRGGSNWDLSALRATEVVQKLVATHGFSPDRLVAVGYGEHRPMYSNETADGRRRNRRVEFHITTPPPVKDLGRSVATAD